ncbi:MAG TPA: histidinol-phosphatase [Armatimonadota bacterium]|nr:histidinol-phosphatase [Armatimonadota bacterium]
MIDYHVHSIHSGDSPARVREMCLRAVEIGISEICFTEHLDFTPTDISYGSFVYNDWIKDIASAREEFSDRLTIRMGVEVDFQQKYIPQIEDFVSSREFDYVLASAHYVNGVLLENHKDYFPGKNTRDAYAPYFEVALGAAEAGIFDALAHLDLCKRYGVLYFGCFGSEDFQSEIEAVIRAVIKSNMALEINTSGLRQAPGETYPCQNVINRYVELGGRLITIGSDAHTPEQLGYGLIDAQSILAQAGIAEPARFHKRKVITE